MIKKKMKWLISGFLILTVVGIGLGLGYRSNSVPTVSANELVSRSLDSQTPLSLIASNQALYYEKRISQRFDPAIVELDDPYHLPILPLYQGDLIVKFWLTHDGYSQTTVLADNQDFIVSKVVYDSDEITMYDPANNSFLSFPAPSSAESKAAESAYVGSIRTNQKSSWNNESWIVDAEPQPGFPIEYDINPGKLIATNRAPFGADLNFDQIKWVYEIDQETNLLVSQSLLALTSLESTVLYSETRSKPEVFTRSEMPIDWNVFPDDAQQFANLDYGKYSKTTQDPAKLNTVFDFPIYQLSDKTLASFEVPLNQVHVFYNENRSDLDGKSKSNV